MTREDLIKDSPLRFINRGAQETTSGSRLGLVIARAGLGKTAILVQIALDSILRGQKVLHVSIGENLDKTRAWYDDIADLLTEEQRLDPPAAVAEDIMRGRMIMTFKESGFSRPKLEERLKDLLEQNIFQPDCIVVDGFDFTSTDRAAIKDLREFLASMAAQVWFSALSHRTDPRVSKSGVPAPCHELDDLFDTVIVLASDTNAIKLNIVKDSGGGIEVGTSLSLDPATMLVKEG